MTNARLYRLAHEYITSKLYEKLIFLWIRGRITGIPLFQILFAFTYPDFYPPFFWYNFCKQFHSTIIKLGDFCQYAVFFHIINISAKQNAAISFQDTFEGLSRRFINQISAEEECGYIALSDHIHGNQETGSTDSAQKRNA